MNWLKQRWEITKNWQVLYPVIGTLVLGYSAYKLAVLFSFSNLAITTAVTVFIFSILLQTTLALFKFLEKRWKVDQKWKVIRIFMVFAITGSLSIYVTKPVFEFIGLNKENFDSNALTVTFYYILKFILVLPFYKVLLVIFGWIFGEFKFFLNFTIKLANRFGLKKLTDKIASLKIKNKILYSLTAILLMIALLTPSAVKLAHVFENHEHSVCENPQSSHFHELNWDCEFYKFKLNNQLSYTFSNIDFVSFEIFYKRIFSPFQLISKFQQSYTSLRGPPALV